MVQLFSLLLLAFAVSLDSFSVGFTYGLRKMKIPLRSILIIACCSAVSLMTAVFIGHALEKLLSPAWTESIGGIILILLGAWVLFQFFRPDKDKDKDLLPHEKTIVKLEIRSLGLVIHILKKPLSADFDRSGIITGIEALMLGAALSLDAFGAGIGAAMLGFSPFELALSVALMSSAFVYFGLKSGSFFADYQWVQRLTLLPGILLILIGIWKM